MINDKDHSTTFCRDDFSGPIERLTGLPNIAYSSLDFAKFERDEVLVKTWFCVANTAELQQDGWVHPVDVAGLPLLVVRDRESNIRVFHNVCSHRGMKLVEKPHQTNGIITCPYHGWCYHAAGHLSATPHIKGEGVHEDKRFDKSLHGLKPVRSHIFTGMIFVNISGDAPEFDEFIKPVTDFWSDINFDNFSHGGANSSWCINLKSNWKLAQENHVDGYHLPFVHPGLNSYSPLGIHYPLIIKGSASGQGSSAQEHSSAIGSEQLPKDPSMGEDWQKGKAEFLSIFPNVMIGVHADHIWTVYLLPNAPNETTERMDLNYFGNGATDPRFQELQTNNRERMLEIFEEDRDMVEGMQRGRLSPAFDGGALAPEMDGPAHCFNQIAANSFVDAIDRRNGKLDKI